MRTWIKTGLTVAAAVLLASTGIAAASAPPPGNGPTGGSPAPAVAPAAVQVPAVLNNVFVPITPCRIVDTRASGGKIAAGATRSFHVRGSAGFPGQGGKSGGCGIPQSATAVSASITATQAAGQGYLRVWPYGQAEPNATVLNYTATGSGGVTTGAQLTLGGGAAAITVKAYNQPTHVVIDVSGYYAPQLAAFVGSDGTLTYATPRVTASTHPSTGNYTVTFDTDVSRCAFQVTPYAYNWAVAVGPGTTANQANVFIHDQVSPFTPHDTTFYIQAVC